MLLRVDRENEVSYYNLALVKKIVISQVYGDDNDYDVSLVMEDDLEPIAVFSSNEDAEAFVAKLDQQIQLANSRSSWIISAADLK